MAINISDLPPKYQAQAVKKYMEQQARRGLMPSAQPRLTETNHRKGARPL